MDNLPTPATRPGPYAGHKYARPLVAAATIAARHKQESNNPMDTYDITMSDVIARSIAMHPTLLADAMRAIAKIHSDAALAMTHDAYAANIARGMAASARASAEALKAGELDIDGLTLRACVQLFSAAARLLLIPIATQKSIAAR
jgi:hypothetical protein